MSEPLYKKNVVKMEAREAMTSMADDDNFVIHDKSEAQLKKISKTNLKEDLGINENAANIALKASQADLEAVEASIPSDSNLDELAGDGWTTETVKGNADDILTNANNIAANLVKINTNIDNIALKANSSDLDLKANQTDLDTTNVAVALNTAKTGITTEQASDIEANNLKVSNIDHPLVEKAVPSNAVFTDTVYDDTAIQAEIDLKADQSDLDTTNTNVSANTINIATNASNILLKADLTDVADNTDDIATNSTNIATNTTNIATNTANIALKANQTDLDTTNSAVALNTAKTGITTDQANAIVANTAKTGITSAQSSAIEANTLKTGITTTQASDIIANNAKPTKTNYTGTISTTWTGSEAPYTQAVSISGLLATDNPHITVDYSATLATAILEKAAWNLIDYAETTADTITFTSLTTAPETELSIILEVLR